jgi:putative sterol carrier protein
MTSELHTYMTGMARAYDPNVAPGLEADVQLLAGGEGGGDFVLSIHDGKAEAVEGRAQNPSVTINVLAADWIAILKGELDPMRAFMTGKLKFTGDMGLMMKFQRLFSQKSS